MNVPALVVIPGWASPPERLQALVAGWPAPVIFLPLDDQTVDPHLDVNAHIARWQRLVPQGPWVCLGWSLGGLLAMRLAAACASACARVLTLCSTPCFVAQPSWPGVAQVQAQTFLARLVEEPAALLEHFEQLQRLGDAQGRSVRQASRDLAGHPPPSSAVLATTLNWLLTLDDRARWTDGPVPAQHWLGSEDRLVPLRTEWQDGCIQGMAHWPHAGWSTALQPALTWLAYGACPDEVGA